MFIHQIPHFVTLLFPQLNWAMPVIGTEDRRVYFTFDDGPTPEITNFVLDELDKFNAKATFFCIGKNVAANPDIFQSIIAKGHSVGNHTMNHANACKYGLEDYLNDFQKCDNVFTDLNAQSIGFRPPYGRINKKVIQAIKADCPIFMWSILTGDYNSTMNPATVLKKCLPKIKPGDIIVFHDSVKASKNLRILLPEFLSFCVKNNLVPSAL